MAAVFEQFTSELSSLLVLVWPDVNQVYEEEHLDLVPWEQVEPPIANVELGSMGIDAAWGFANQVHSGNVTLTWVGATTGDSTTQRSRVETLRDAILSATFTAANIIDIVSADWSDTVPINRVFLEKGYLFRAGVLTVSVIVAAKVAP